jgi:hypothetical protein
MKIALLLGGPSMKSVDFSLVKADAFVGVNWAFLIPQVQVNVVCDYRLMDRILSDYEPNKDGVPAVTHFKNWISDGGENFFVDHARQASSYFLTMTVKSTYPVWPRYPQQVIDGLYCRNNVGLSGLCAASLLIPSKGEIHVYGLDLDEKTESGKTENWHKHHDPSWSADADVSYPHMMREFDEAKKNIQPGIRVINMNRASAYKGFEFV